MATTISGSLLCPMGLVPACATASRGAFPACVPVPEDLQCIADDALSQVSTILTTVSRGKARKLRKQRLKLSLSDEMESLGPLVCAAQLPDVEEPRGEVADLRAREQMLFRVIARLKRLHEEALGAADEKYDLACSRANKWKSRWMELFDYVYSDSEGGECMDDDSNSDNVQSADDEECVAECVQDPGAIRDELSQWGGLKDYCFFCTCPKYVDVCDDAKKAEIVTLSAMSASDRDVFNPKGAAKDEKLEETLKAFMGALDDEGFASEEEYYAMEYDIADDEKMGLERSIVGEESNIAVPKESIATLTKEIGVWHPGLERGAFIPKSEAKVEELEEAFKASEEASRPSSDMCGIEQEFDDSMQITHNNDAKKAENATASAMSASELDAFIQKGAAKVEELEETFKAVMGILDEGSFRSEEEYCAMQLDTADDKRKGLVRSIVGEESSIAPAKASIATLTQEIRGWHPGPGPGCCAATEQRKV